MTNDVTYVYVVRMISDDTNPWDSNESYGVYGSLESAKAGDLGYAGSWVPARDTYTGHGGVRTWTLSEDGTDPETGHGFFIFEEELR